MSEKALLIIDMLNDFILPNGLLTVGETGEKIIASVANEIQKARDENIPVIYVCDNHRHDDPEFKVWPPHCVIGSPGAQVIKELAPKPGDYFIPKRRFSGFFETQLDLTLRELGVKELTLTGVCTNICVLYTACDARMRNYQVNVVRDAVATFDPNSHEFAIGEMIKTLGCRII